MYGDFAQLYDELMEEFPYEDYINSLMELCPPRGKILEIGCGTGTITSFLFRQGVELLALLQTSAAPIHTDNGRKRTFSFGENNS